MTILTVRRALLGLVTLVMALIWAFPVYWMVNSSLLPNVTLQSTTPTFLPFGGSFDNFAAVFTDPGFTRALGVSLAVTLATVFVALIVAFLGALAISRFKFRGRKSFILALLLIQMLPAEGLFIAQYKMMSGLTPAQQRRRPHRPVCRRRRPLHGVDAARLRRRRPGRTGGGRHGRRG
jgi:N,N'-diacetylchitobiose transport system permease protein